MSGGLRDALAQIISLIILALPLFALPALLKFSGGILGRIHDMTRRGAGKYGGDQLHGAQRKKMKQSYDRSDFNRNMQNRKHAKDERLNENYVNRLKGESAGIFGGIRSRASRLQAHAAITPGQQHDALALQRLAREQSRKHYNEEVDRHIGDWNSGQLFNHNYHAYEVDDNGNKLTGPLGMHDRLAAIGSGRKVDVYSTDAAGNDVTKTLSVDGSHEEKVRAAAYKRVADTGDKKAVNALHLNQALGKTGDKVKYSVKSGSDDEALMLTYFQDSNGIAASNPHYRQSPAGAFNSPTAEKVKSYSAEEAEFAIEKYYKPKFATLQNALSTATASGDATAIAEADQALKDHKEIVNRFFEAYTEVTHNRNALGYADKNALAIAEQFANANGKTIW